MALNHRTGQERRYLGILIWLLSYGAVTILRSVFSLKISSGILQQFKVGGFSIEIQRAYLLFIRKVGTHTLVQTYSSKSLSISAITRD